jgi:hypothetical protein
MDINNYVCDGGVSDSGTVGAGKAYLGIWLGVPVYLGLPGYLELPGTYQRQKKETFRILPALDYPLARWLHQIAKVDRPAKSQSPASLSCLKVMSFI